MTGCRHFTTAEPDKSGRIAVSLRPFEIEDLPTQKRKGKRKEKKKGIKNKGSRREKMKNQYPDIGPANKFSDGVWQEKKEKEGRKEKKKRERREKDAVTPYEAEITAICKKNEAELSLKRNNLPWNPPFHNYQQEVGHHFVWQFCIENNTSIFVALTPIRP
ncbi:hypothetical protein K435DRAFT_803330 [Dendrothele bispora CBS 962.96]|uniref:Uncharacterized protein n=1 Tax=Dendrothele bispora (strain CBS 962.96) TaxID=1314807 RepID=A0A4V4HDW7_DENBC|nr:hypothetical protein K435DRAFT_803330 [Dendrothele bispora CBS 962.96]